MASNPTPTPAPVTVSANAATNDPLFAFLRYAVVIIAAFPTLLALLKDHDVAAIHAYFTSDAGRVVVAAAVGLGTMAYGLWKTYRRGSSLVSAATDPANQNVALK